jgi:predicted Fe-Mo cluster-binding NifX family protein
MRVCLPTQQDRGLESLPDSHFGSAPYFLVYDTETKEMKTIDNRDEHHAHGACNPLKALAGDTVDAIVVGGVGSRAIAGLNGLGIRVLSMPAKSLIRLLAESLFPFTNPRLLPLNQPSRASVDLPGKKKAIFIQGLGIPPLKPWQTEMP